MYLMGILNLFVVFVTLVSIKFAADEYHKT